MTRTGVVSTIAGTGTTWMSGRQELVPPDACEVAAASFQDPALVAVDIHGRVLVVDWGMGDDLLLAVDNAQGDTTRFRKIDRSSNQFTTLCDKEGVALHNIECKSCAIDDRGSIWCVGSAGIVIIENTGFSAGFHAWSFVPWSPSARSHGLCAIQAREAAVVVLSINARTYLGAPLLVGCGPCRLWQRFSGLFLSLSSVQRAVQVERKKSLER